MSQGRVGGFRVRGTGCKVWREASTYDGSCMWDFLKFFLTMRTKKNAWETQMHGLVTHVLFGPFPVSLSLAPPPPPHAHRHTHARSHAHARTRTHTHTRAHTSLALCFRRAGGYVDPAPEPPPASTDRTGLGFLAAVLVMPSSVAHFLYRTPEKRESGGGGGQGRERGEAKRKRHSVLRERAERERKKGRE